MIRSVRRFLRNRSALLGSVIVAVFLTAAAIGPTIAPFDPNVPDYNSLLALPSLRHPLGTDMFGRDIMSRILWGSRISLGIAVTGVSGSLLLGVPLGLVAGYYGGALDSITMRVLDVLLAFPGILLAIGIIALLGPGLVNVVVAIVIYGIPIFARTTRGQVLSLKGLGYVEAARASGASDLRILAIHLLPNSVSPIIVALTLNMATAVLTASGLSFLGLGAQPPTPEWGAMLSEARSYLTRAPHAALFPGLTIFLAALGFNLMGDGLNDYLNPRIKSRQ
jgi:ABC-type dipeptide/oligopeptide/nickel transport system permease subunit